MLYVYVPRETLEQIRAIAKEQNASITYVVTRALKRYVTLVAGADGGLP